MWEQWKIKFKTWLSRFRTVGTGSGFLCDSCKWNYGNVCTRPERPNAKECPEYTPK